MFEVDAERLAASLSPNDPLPAVSKKIHLGEEYSLRTFLKKKITISPYLSLLTDP